MRAVLMAGGEGTRLRPMTASTPKPLLPVVDRPLMEHVLLLLRRHGFAETVVTVQYLASLIRAYFGDGSDLGVQLEYVSEERPLGTAGSVRNAADALGDEPFLVISGDAITDIDLGALTEFHRSRGALVTVCLTRRDDPLEFGITNVDEQGRVVRFLEKPTWGEVFSDTVNTGIYVMEPEVLGLVPADRTADWSADVFPALLASGAPIFGYVADGYWEDVGTFDSYLRVHGDALERKVHLDLGAFEVAPGVWMGEGTEIDDDVELEGPVYFGSYTRVEAGASIGARSVLGSNVIVRSGARVERSVVHDNVFIGHHAELRGCIVGKHTDVMRGARVEEGAVVGDECVLGDETIAGNGVRIYPGKTIEAGTVLHDSVIWEARGSRSLLGSQGVTGLVNVEVTPEYVVRLAAAFASTLPKGATVSIGRDHSRAARALNRAMAAGLTSAAARVRDLRSAPLPVIRSDTARASSGGVMMRTTPGQPESIDILLLDEGGNDLSPAMAVKLDRVLSRQEYRRAFPGEIGDLISPSRAVEDYTFELLRAIDLGGVADAGLKIVVDAAGGLAAPILPTLLSRVGVDILTVNGRLDDTHPTETERGRREALTRLASLVASSGSDFGVRFDPTAEHMSLVDETGRVIDDERALLVLLDLVAAERRTGTVALPVTTTRVAEQVTAFHHVGVTWTRTSPDALARAALAPGLQFAGDGRGGFVVPEAERAPTRWRRSCGSSGWSRAPSSPSPRSTGASPRPSSSGAASTRRGPARARSCARSARPRGTAPSIPPTASGWWSTTAAGPLVLPDPGEPTTRIWAESHDQASAEVLAAAWADVVAAAAGQR